MDLRCHVAQSAFYREEETQTRDGEGACIRSGTAICFEYLSRDLMTHPASSGKWGKSSPPNSGIRSVINACGSHLLFYNLEDAHLNLLSGNRDWKGRNIFFHMSGSQGNRTSTFEKGEIINHHEIQTAFELFVKSWLLENKPKSVESKSHNVCFLCGFIG